MNTKIAPGEGHPDCRGNRSRRSAQMAADDLRGIGRNQPRYGLTNLGSREELIFVEPLLAGDQMVAQIRNHASAETGPTDIKENSEQLRQADVRGVSRRIFHSGLILR